MENQREPAKETPADQEGESRREFIRKLPYIAPAVQTFLLSETAFGSNRRGGGDEGGHDDEGEGGRGGEGEGHDDEGEGHDDEGGGRRRRQVSPHTRGRGRGRG